MALDPKKARDIGREGAMMIGRLLQQTYHFENGKWWLYAADKSVRLLTPSEVDWHRNQKHLPADPAEGTVVDPSKFTAEEWFGG